GVDPADPPGDRHGRRRHEALRAGRLSRRPRASRTGWKVAGPGRAAPPAPGSASAGDGRGVVPRQLPDPPVLLEPAQAAVFRHVVPAAPFAPDPAAEFGRVPGDVVAIRVDPGEV